MTDELRRIRQGEPCSHPGCMSHKSHPCEGCGRQWGDELRRRCEGEAESIFQKWNSCFETKDDYEDMKRLIVEALLKREEKLRMAREALNEIGKNCYPNQTIIRVLQQKIGEG